MLALTLTFTGQTPFITNTVTVVGETYGCLDRKLDSYFDSETELDYGCGDKNLTFRVGNFTYKCIGTMSSTVILEEK